MFTKIATATVLLLSGCAALAQAREGALLDNADTDYDGKVSKEEFVDGPTPLFNQFDADHNDVLDAKELEAARGAAEERFRQRRQQ